MSALDREHHATEREVADQEDLQAVMDGAQLTFSDAGWEARRFGDGEFDSTRIIDAACCYCCIPV